MILKWTGSDASGVTPEVPQVDPDETEWNTVEITFTWEAGEPPLDMGTVTVSYDPVSNDAKDKRPRFASGPTNDVIDDRTIAPRRCCSRT